MKKHLEWINKVAQLSASEQLKVLTDTSIPSKDLAAVADRKIRANKIRFKRGKIG